MRNHDLYEPPPPTGQVVAKKLPWRLAPDTVAWRSAGGSSPPDALTERGSTMSTVRGNDLRSDHPLERRACNQHVPPFPR